jgi:hypothetical protein
MTASPDMPNRVPPQGSTQSDPFIEAAKARAGAATGPKSTTAADDESTRDPAAGPDAFAEAMQRLGEVREYASYLAAAEIDKLKLKARRIVILAAAGIVAGILGLAILVSAAAILLQGIAGFIGELLGGRPWAGAIITGSGILALTALGAWLGLRAWQAASFKALQKRYEYRKQKQRTQFGQSVDPLDDLSH